MKFVIVFVCACVVINVGYAQEETEMIAAQTELVEPTDLICNTCACVDGVVDCAGKSIQSFFTLADWTGLKEKNPTTVDLHSNSLPSVTTIAELPIQTLNLSICHIEKIQNTAFANLKDLVVLDLSYNRIATSALSKRVFMRRPPGNPGIELSSFESMRTLNLAYNDIHSLPQDLFDFMPGLTTLDLSGNPLAFIDQVTQSAITSLQSLKELNLASCELDNLPEGLFRRQRGLARLDLSNNRFTAVPSVLGEAVNLVYLNMNKNLMVNLTERTAMSSLTKLEELKLCRLSKLSYIAEGALGGLESLVALHICHNPRLTTIEPGFLMWTDDHDVERYPLLQKLHLQSNNISVINSHFLDRWEQLTDVDFSNNPYDCDCNARWMVEVLSPLISASARNQTLNNMFCKKPQDIRGLSFATLVAANRVLECPENEQILDLPTPNSAIILGIMIGIFVTFPLVLVIVLLWRKGYFAKCRRKVIKEKYDEDDNEDEAL